MRTILGVQLWNTIKHSYLVLWRQSYTRNERTWEQSWRGVLMWVHKCEHVACIQDPFSWEPQRGQVRNTHPIDPKRPANASHKSAQLQFRSCFHHSYQKENMPRKMLSSVVIRLFQHTLNFLGPECPCIDKPRSFCLSFWEWLDDLHYCKPPRYHRDLPSSWPNRRWERPTSSQGNAERGMMRWTFGPFKGKKLKTLQYNLNV